MFWPVRKVLAKLAVWQARRVRRQFHELTKRPTETQRQHLFNQLERERETGFGRDHHFASIRTVSDFRRSVPVTGYEYYRPYIERVKAGETEAMFHRQEVLMFALTSGTTDTRKFIPVDQEVPGRLPSWLDHLGVAHVREPPRAVVQDDYPAGQQTGTSSKPPPGFLVEASAA